MFILQVMSSRIQFKISCFQFSSLQELSIIPYSVPCSKRSNESKRDVDFFFFSFTLKLIPRFYHLVKTNLCRVSKKHIAAICCRATHRFTITKQNAALTPPSKKKTKKKTQEKTEKRRRQHFQFHPPITDNLQTENENPKTSTNKISSVCLDRAAEWWKLSPERCLNLTPLGIAQLVDCCLSYFLLSAIKVPRRLTEGVGRHIQRLRLTEGLQRVRGDKDRKAITDGVQRICDFSARVYFCLSAQTCQSQSRLNLKLKVIRQMSRYICLLKNGTCPEA